MMRETSDHTGWSEFIIDSGATFSSVTSEESIFELDKEKSVKFQSSTGQGKTKGSGYLRVQSSEGEVKISNVHLNPEAPNILSANQLTSAGCEIILGVGGGTLTMPSGTREPLIQRGKLYIWRPRVLTRSTYMLTGKTGLGEGPSILSYRQSGMSTYSQSIHPDTWGKLVSMTNTTC